MPEAYPIDGVWERKKWQTERDKAKIAKGACSKVSMGDELDKFRKDFAKGFDKYKGATQRLIDKATIYATALEKSKNADEKAWAARVRRFIISRCDEMMKDFDLIDKARGEYDKGVKIAKAAWPKVKTETLLWLTRSDGEKLNVPQMKVFITGLQAIDTHGARLRYVTDEVSKESRVLVHKTWYHVDGGGEVDVEWVNSTDKLVKDLAVLG